MENLDDISGKSSPIKDIGKKAILVEEVKNAYQARSNDQQTSPMKSVDSFLPITQSWKKSSLIFRLDQMKRAQEMKI